MYYDSNVLIALGSTY